MTPDQIKRMQERLGVTVDGQDGRTTYTALFSRMGAPAALAPLLGLAAAAHFPRFAINETPLRLSHFMGQTSLESGRFRWMREIWGPTAAQRAYEGNVKGLGNTQPGDGKRYMGRAPIMTTGRRNYRLASLRLGIDVEAQPELLERADIGLQSSCIWWDDNGANAWADRDDSKALSRLINRGDPRSPKAANHEDDRLAYTLQAKDIIL